MRSLKYLLLGFFAWAIANMTPDAIERFMHAPTARSPTYAC